MLNETMHDVEDTSQLDFKKLLNIRSVNVLMYNALMT